jgi:hypothetical protein
MPGVLLLGSSGVPGRLTGGGLALGGTGVESTACLGAVKSVGRVESLMKLFVSNISYQASEVDLHEVFLQAGVIVAGTLTAGQKQVKDRASSADPKTSPLVVLLVDAKRDSRSVSCLGVLR